MLRRPQVADAANGGHGRLGRGGAKSGTPEVRLSYSPGLDGLRALAVSAVLPFIPGGFLGVEVFFVVSGYLFYGDGYHLRPRAQKIYAHLLESHLDD